MVKLVIVVKKLLRNCKPFKIIVEDLEQGRSAKKVLAT